MGSTMKRAEIGLIAKTEGEAEAGKRLGGKINPVTQLVTFKVNVLRIVPEVGAIVGTDEIVNTVSFRTDQTLQENLPIDFLHQEEVRYQVRF